MFLNDFSCRISKIFLIKNIRDTSKPDKHRRFLALNRALLTFKTDKSRRFLCSKLTNADDTDDKLKTFDRFWRSRSNENPTILYVYCDQYTQLGKTLFNFRMIRLELQVCKNWDIFLCQTHVEILKKSW